MSENRVHSAVPATLPHRRRQQSWLRHSGQLSNKRGLEASEGSGNISYILYHPFHAVQQLFGPRSNSCPSPPHPSTAAMSDQSALQDPPPPTDVIFSRNSSNMPALSSSSSALPSSADSPDHVQEISYYPPDSANPSPMQTRKSGHSQSNGTPTKRPCGPCYTREELLHLKKSPLVAPPPGMPARKDWFGYVLACSFGQVSLIVDYLASTMNSLASQRTMTGWLPLA